MAIKCDRYSIIVVKRCCNEQEGMGGRGCYEAFDVSLSKTALGAYLGGSSKYSNESLKDRSGEGFHVNSSWPWLVDPKRQGCSAHAGFASYLEREWS